MTTVQPLQKPAEKRADAPAGRHCHVCGRGPSARLGMICGFRAALLAAGYDLEPGRMYFAHVVCAQRLRDQ